MLSLKLPQNTAKVRPYGVRSIIKKNKVLEKVKREDTQFHEEKQEQLRPKESFHDNPNDIVNTWNCDDTKTITVVGVSRETIDYVEDYFNNNFGDRIQQIIKTPVQKHSLNWILIEFDENPRSIEEIKPLFQIKKDLCVGCFYGIFEADIPEHEQKKELPVFRVWDEKQNLSNVAWEHKTLWIKIREFLFGHGDIRITEKQSILWSILNYFE